MSLISINNSTKNIFPCFWSFSCNKHMHWGRIVWNEFRNFHELAIRLCHMFYTLYRMKSMTSNNFESKWTSQNIKLNNLQFKAPTMETLETIKLNSNFICYIWFNYRRKHIQNAYERSQFQNHKYFYKQTQQQ